MNKKEEYDKKLRDRAMERIKENGLDPDCQAPDRDMNPCWNMWSNRCDSSCIFNCWH